MVFLIAAAVVTVCTVAVLIVGMWRSVSEVAIASPGPTPAGPAPVGPADVSPASPLDQLVAQAGVDRPEVEQLVGYWVPQVSSKKLGTVDAGHEYSYADIVEYHEQLASRFSGILLTRSDDFGSFAFPGYWVTVVGRRFSTAAEANAWCDAQAIPADHCFAKRLLHSSSAAGNTVHR